MTKLVDHFVDNNGVLVNYLESLIDSNQTPLLYIPGMLGSAEQFEDEMKALDERKCYSISLRGNGKSTAPEAGYSFAEQFTDLEAVIKGLDIEQFYLMSYSMGVPYAVQAAIKYPQKLKGLIICDYSARIPQVPNGWAQNLIDNDKIEPERAHVVKAIERELKSVDLTEELNQIQCPVLVMRGLKEGSLLKDAKLEEYKNRLNHLEIIEFENSGHELWHPDVEYFRDTIQAFMKKYD